jgi:hypothetical protein
MRKILLLIATVMVAMTANAAFYVAGNGKEGNPWCGGKSWASDGSEMVGNTITFSGVPAGTYEFKVTDGTWNFALNVYNVDASQSTPGYKGTDNVQFTIASTADITISTDGTNIVLKSTVPFGDVVITSWAICGVAELLGDAWSPSSAANQMTEVSAGQWQLVKKAVSLVAGAYEYKAAANGDWGISEVPASGNQTLTIDADGVYDITFTLYAGDGYLEAIATPSTSTAIDEVDSEDVVIAAYDLLGRPAAADAKGYVILQYASGKSAKVYNY